MGDVSEKLKKYFKEDPEFSVHTNISDETRLIESGILDSFSVVKLMAYIEKEFQIKIEVEDLAEENIASLQSIEAFVLRKKK